MSRSNCKNRTGGRKKVFDNETSNTLNFETQRELKNDLLNSFHSVSRGQPVSRC